MRATDDRESTLFSCIATSGTLPVNHPLRAIRALLEPVLQPRFASATGKADNVAGAGSFLAACIVPGFPLTTPTNQPRF
jgi:hypothetical protein